MTNEQMEKEVTELYYDLAATSIKEDFIDLILTFAKKIRAEVIKEMEIKVSLCKIDRTGNDYNYDVGDDDWDDCVDMCLEAIRALEGK